MVCLFVFSVFVGSQKKMIHAENFTSNALYVKGLLYSKVALMVGAVRTASLNVTAGTARRKNYTTVIV